MTLAFEKLSHLPTLSWCARVERGGRTTVRHGSGVETRHDGFVEGAWDGEFEAFDFDKAKTLAGTGGRLRDNRMVFAAPFHPLERLFLLREAGEVVVSNSLVFLLSEVSDQLDICYPNYFFDLLATARRGIAAPPARLCTAGGSEVEVYPCCNLELDSELNFRRVDKPIGAPPADYADYFGLLLATTRALAKNAAAPQRTDTYRLVAACSTGYDSTAAAAIASLAGCEEGVTYVSSTEVSGNRVSGVAVVQGDDSGAASLRALGMTVTEYGREDVTSIAGHPRAEFYVSPIASTDATTRIMEEQLGGSIFVSGRNGGRYWGLSRSCNRANLGELDERHLSGHSLGEFRLRVGFVNLPLPYIGALHGPAIYRISHSDEMLPWKLGTSTYDRPIARRIAEEAGVPREMFGQRKRGGGQMLTKLSQKSEEDFENFLQAEVPKRIRQQLDPRPIRERLRLHRRMAYLRIQYAHLPLVGSALDLLGIDRMHALWNSTNLYQFHWGFAKLRERYLANRVQADT